MYERTFVGTDGSATASKAVDRAAEAARLAQQGLSVETTTAVGDPAAVLVDLAAGYDLLVVGNKGTSGPGRFFLGSVPNKVSHHAPRSLLIVHAT